MTPAAPLLTVRYASAMTPAAPHRHVRVYAICEIYIEIACVDARPIIKKTLPGPTHPITHFLDQHTACAQHTHKHQSRVHINHHTHACIPPNRSLSYNIMHTRTKHSTPTRMPPATQARVQQTARGRKTRSTHMHSTQCSSTHTCRPHANFPAVYIFMYVKYPKR